MKQEGSDKDHPVSEVAKNWVEMCQTGLRQLSPTKEFVSRQITTSLVTAILIPSCFLSEESASEVKVPPTVIMKMPTHDNVSDAKERILPS